jgi:hypothetical protein
MPLEADQPTDVKKCCLARTIGPDHPAFPRRMWDRMSQRLEPFEILDVLMLGDSRVILSL